MKQIDKSRMLTRDKYLLLQWGDDYRIMNDDANFLVGGARPLRDARFVVDALDNDYDYVDVAIVNSLDEVIPAIAAYYEANPPRWSLDHDGDFWHGDVKPSVPRYIKNSHFGPLIVFEITPGQWVAYRNQCELLLNGKIATFATSEEAQRKADAHERESYPNSVSLDDGYSWSFSEEVDWPQNPHVVANRARRMVHPNTN